MGENKRGGVTSLDKFNPKTSFAGLHIRFLPDSSTDAQLNSKDMLAKATFMWAEDLKRESAESRPTDGGTTGGSGGSTGGDTGDELPGGGGASDNG